MPCAILLEQSYRIVIVKDAWVEAVTGAENRNVGSDVNQTVKFFYSQNKAAKANFRLNPRDIFDSKQTGCYFGNVLNICGKFILIDGNT